MKTFIEYIVGLCIVCAIFLAGWLWQRYEESNVPKAMTKLDILLSQPWTDSDAFIAKMKEIDVDNCPDDFCKEWNDYLDEVIKTHMPFSGLAFENLLDLYKVASKYGYTRQSSPQKRHEESPILIIKPPK